MIISHTHKFIFAKSCKTAGTSVEVFFSAYCSERDIMTKIGEKTADWHKQQNAAGYYNHIGIGEIRAKFAQFDKYYKFTVVRHPLDRMLSLYHWQNPQVDFNKWIKQGVRQGKAANLEYFYRIGGAIAVDDFIRYERLEEDIKRICGILGLDYDSKYLLHYKKRKRKDIDITEKTKEFLRVKFKQELIDFGYEII